MTLKLLLVLLASMIPFRESENSINTDLCSRFIRSHSTDSDGRGRITMIDEINWTEVLTGEWLLILCSLPDQKCKDLERSLYNLAATSMGCLDIGLAVCDLSKLSTMQRRFSAFADETIYHVLDGDFRKLNAKQDLISLRDLLHLREWMEIHTVPFWRHPTSIFTNFSVFAFSSLVTLLRSGLVGRNVLFATIILDLVFVSIMDIVILTIYVLWCLASKIISNYHRSKKTHYQLTTYIN
ncbi:thioredoxin-related transmembrane protein 1 [Drosophila biarmipes]|uniref:thioredoxin-related transmembrane protein 1 n=1 Tax=Drosophila biarmipes TaxID=125945 RepID=UPI0007E85E85|nr:thioredoxin-related transmembrane protein 1 [Drosophila biarmipes]